MSRFRPLCLILLALLGGCGPDAPRVLPPRPPLHLIVTGTDREMGVAHGKALAKEIADEVGPRLAARFRAVATDVADAKFLERVCRLYTSKVKPLLSAEVREELAGIAEGSGVPEDSILLLEVMREALRLHLDAPPLVEASLACAPDLSPTRGFLLSGQPNAPPAIVAAWDGAGGLDLSGHALLLERRPTGPARATLVVTWPGGLGALAGVSSLGLCVASGEIAGLRERQTLHGVPFTVGLRTALERAADLDTLVASLPRLNTVRVLATEGGVGRRLGVVSHTEDDVRAPERGEWLLAAAGAGEDDARAHALTNRLGAYRERPGEGETIALAVTGRASQEAAVIEVSPVGIIWRTGIGLDGKPGPVSADLAFVGPSARGR